MIPDKIKIGWKVYKIKAIENVLLDNIACYGRIDYDDTVIYLRQSNTQEQNKATLLHEILHGISDMYNLDFGEDIIARLGDALYTVACDNRLEREYV